MNSTYQVKKVREDVYQIMESGLDAMYVVCGTEKSILIDTGVGTGDLKSLVQKLTNTKIDVYLTHGHRDHFGGTTQFPSVFLSPYDFELTRDIDVDKRKEYVEKMIHTGAADKESLKEMRILDWGNKPELKPITNGQKIELGDKTLTCIEVGGHTNGSVMYYDEGNNIIFSGDGANPIMVLRKKATETTGRSAKCDKDDFHSKLPWKSFCPYSILQIFMKELFEFVERNDIHLVVQIRMVRIGNNQ